MEACQNVAKGKAVKTVVMVSAAMATTLLGC